jgi:Protein of unknown function (DUF4238)
VTRAVASGHLAPPNDTSYEEFCEFIERGEYEIVVPTTEHVLLELKLFEEILPFLLQRRWLLISAGAGSGGFITTDHPVALMWRNPDDRSATHPPGHALKGTEVLFPISRNLALSGTFEGEEGTVVARPEWVAALNGLLIQHGRRQVYAPNDDFRYYLTDERGVRRGADLITDLVEAMSDAARR